MLSTNLNPAKLNFLFEQLKGFAVVEHAPDPLQGAEKEVMEPQTAKECLDDKYGKGYKLGLRKAYAGTKTESYAIEKEHA